MNGDDFRTMTLEFVGAEIVPHFERIGCKVAKRRMFDAYLEADNTANIFLTPNEQKAFCRIDKKNILPVPNKWGEKGATIFQIANIEASIIREALTSAYAETLRSRPRK